MAALVGDMYSTESSRFHGMVGGPDLQRQRTHSTHSERHDPHYRNRSASRSRDTIRDAPALQQPQHTPTVTTTQTPRSARCPGPITDRATNRPDTQQLPVTSATSQHESTDGGASRFPSPPSSGSSHSSSSEARPQHGTGSVSMASTGDDASASSRLAPTTATPSIASSTSTATTVVPAHPSSHQIPSPASDSGPRWNHSLSDLAAQAAASHFPDSSSPAPTQRTIHVRDLAHIESLARTDMLTGRGYGSSMSDDPPLQAMKYEISAMPINDVIEMVAALLTKITTTNDKQHDALNRNAAHIRQAQAQAASRSEDPNNPNANDTMSPLSSSVLAFHGKNVPAITIMSYLSRIHKYCPTTYEVFLSLLVYFDRMTERVNDMVFKAEEARRQQQQAQATQTQSLRERPQDRARADLDTAMRDESDDSDEVDSDLADDDDTDEPGSDRGGAPTGTATPDLVREHERAASATSPLHQPTYFVVDSFNIHRLIIAGVTCASKFFSDVFYTNSRYAKVCCISRSTPSVDFY